MANGVEMVLSSLDANGLHIHLDPVGGAAGDMFVAAMLDAFPGLTNRVLEDIGAVLPIAIGQALVAPVMASGLRAKSFQLVLADGATTGRNGTATTYAAMRKLLLEADLSQGASEAACAILQRIAEAEAHVHNICIDKVHFHEIADWDSLMDVTAAGSICAALAEASWSLSPLPLGGGLVQTAHGKLPVPAPATAIILEGFDWHDDGISGERVTPTGAAILAEVLGGKHFARKGGNLLASGSGAGMRSLEGVPNILRATVFRSEKNASLWHRDSVIQLACDIDDMTGEELGAAVDHLRSQKGVIDIVLLNCQGKKSRPASRIEVLVSECKSNKVAEEIFGCTSTLGLRRTQIDRLTLARTIEESPDGKRCKRALRPDGTETIKVESDELSVYSSLSTRRNQANRSESK